MASCNVLNDKNGPVIKIRKYQVKDHKNVRRLFSQGNNEHVANGIKIGLRSPKVLAYLAVAFVWGYQYSIYLAITALTFGLSVQVVTVYLVDFFYVR